MSQVAGILAGAASGSGSLVMVVGGPASGKTRFAQEAVVTARQRGARIVWVTCEPALSVPGYWPWAQCLRQLGPSGQQLAARIVDEDAGLDGELALFDAVTRVLVGEPEPTLVVLDDLHGADDGSRRLLAFLGRRLVVSHLIVLATIEPAAGEVGEELVRLAKVIDLHGGNRVETLLALGQQRWGEGDLAAGQAIFDEAVELARSAGDAEGLVAVALGLPSSAGFLDVDMGLVRLIEDALAVVPAHDRCNRARLLARLSMELLGDRGSDPRRRQLADDALELARQVDDPGCVGFALHARQHALWEPHQAPERLAGAAEIAELARRAGDVVTELEGRLWGFIALMELGRIADAETQLASYARLAEAADRDDLRSLARSRQATVALVRGRFDDGVALAEEAYELGRRAGVVDAERVHLTLMASVLTERDPAGLAPMVDAIRSGARWLPGQLFETTLVAVLVALGRGAEAAAELQRALPQVLAGTGPRWLFAAATLAGAAAQLGDVIACGLLFPILQPYADRMVMPPGAVSWWGSVSYYLGRAAAGAGRLDEGVAHLERATARHREMGALAWLAHGQAELAGVLDSRAHSGDRERAASLAAEALATARMLGMTVLCSQLERATASHTGMWVLERDGADWLLGAGSERARLRDSRGLHYLASLLGHPGQDVRALDLAAGGPGLAGTDAGPVLDQRAKVAYRHRLAELDAELDAADRAGDHGRAERAAGERGAILAELGRATGLAGRERHIGAEGERARVNVTRTLRLAIDRITDLAPMAGAHLRASIRTGTCCRYEPAAGGPRSWRL